MLLLSQELSYLNAYLSSPHRPYSLLTEHVLIYLLYLLLPILRWSVSSTRAGTPIQRTTLYLLYHFYVTDKHFKLNTFKIKCLVGWFTQELEMPLEMPTSLISVHGSNPDCTADPMSRYYHSGDNRWCLPPRWEIWAEFLVPDLHLSQPQLL